MKNAKIVLVAAWDGWCGACAVERPLVLTRSGRLGLRTWLTAPVDDVLPLTLTCRLCGSSALVPSEADDPPVLLEPEEEPTDVVPSLLEDLVHSPGVVAPAAPAPALAAPALAAPVLAAPALAAPVLAAPLLAAPAAAPVVVAAPAAQQPLGTSPEAELAQARGALGAALTALVAQRTALAERVTLTPSVLPHVPAVAPPVLPLQRTASTDEDGLATLQLLADGLDLLSSTRA